MKRWAAVVVVLYGLTLIIFTTPVLIAAFWDVAKNEPDFDYSALRSVYLQWPYWTGVAVFVLSQAALLAIPVRAMTARPASRRSVWLTIVTSAFMMAILAGSFAMAVSEVMRGKQFTDEDIWLWISLAVLATSWVAWGSVFYGWSRNKEPVHFLQKVCRALFIGSILELLVAVPTHIVVRYRNYCCAGIGTFCGITAGLAVMLLSFGPGVFFLFIERRKRLQPAARKR